MTTAPGLNVIRIVVEEPNTELVLYIKKQNTEASHVKEMQRKKLPAMKIHVQVLLSLIHTSITSTLNDFIMLYDGMNIISNSKLLME